MFKIHDEKQDKWMIGTAKLNTISEPCWISSKSEAMYVHCTAAFQYNGTVSTSTGNPITIFSNDMTVLLAGKQFNESQPELLLAHDVNLQVVHHMYGCSLAIGTVGTGIIYEYNLETGIRKYQFKENEDLCQGEEVEDSVDKIHTFVINYMKQVQPLPADSTPVDLNSAVPFLKDITKLDGHVYEAELNYYDSIEITFEYLGKLDTEGHFHGYAVLKIHPNHFCLKGVCHTVQYGEIRGTFIHGFLEGMAYITSQDGILISFLPIKNGILHGIGMKCMTKSLCT